MVDEGRFGTKDPKNDPFSLIIAIRIPSRHGGRLQIAAPHGLTPLSVRVLVMELNWTRGS